MKATERCAVTGRAANAAQPAQQVREWQLICRAHLACSAKDALARLFVASVVAPTVSKH